MIFHTPLLVAGNSPMKTLGARQQPTNTCTSLHPSIVYVLHIHVMFIHYTCTRFVLQWLHVYSFLQIQAALLYTNLKGERRLRVHNLALNCSTKYQDIYRSCEIDTLMNYFSKSSKHVLICVSVFSTSLYLSCSNQRVHVHVSCIFMCMYPSFVYTHVI